LLGWPQYRYRLPLEPAMIVAAVPAILALYRRFAARLFRKTVTS